ncbi:hypothetical protein F4559_001735 [Saccharothrix violaceirubra]|uniref:HEAT repeat protein n=1 Tax=Saccharothrix violaceirubra TaxID=413306 RepID=A0A7W7T154_9PSEU|nr:hypothetical protein [Saccharothrix violaceirubra]
MTGWRYMPDAHGRPPCPCVVCQPLGAYGSAKIRTRLSREWPEPTKPEPMARLADAGGPLELREVLYEPGGRGRGDADALAYLVDHPDAGVREALAEALRSYRDGRALQARLALDPDPEVRAAAVR